MIRPILLLVASLGIAAAFFKPAEPHQVPAESRPVLERKPPAAFEDAGLDNYDIEEDTNIQAARKCGFCIGVSSYILFLVIVRYSVFGVDRISMLQCSGREILLLLNLENRSL